MPMLWQLKKLSTGEKLNEPQLLPENWGPIFGMEGFKEKLNDLSWVSMPDMGWFEVGPLEENEDVKKKQIDDTVRHLLNESLAKVAADDPTITKQQRAEWMEYRQHLKEISSQTKYPNEVFWPKKPDA